MIQRFFDRTRSEAAPGPVTREDIYRDLAFPKGVGSSDSPSRRPYIGINMVATLDGKVVVGGPGTTRLIGSDVDHYLMARIDGQADGLIFGAGLIREDNPPYPHVSEDKRIWRRGAGLRDEPLWAVVSSRGDLLEDARMFEAPRHNTALFTTAQIDPRTRECLESVTQVFICGDLAVDLAVMGRFLRDDLGVNAMISLGGPVLNATLLEAGFVDELFMTLAPKLQGGTGIVTLIEGAGYAAEDLPVLDLLSLYASGSELYLRYKVPPEATRLPYTEDSAAAPDPDALEDTHAAQQLTRTIAETGPSS